MTSAASQSSDSSGGSSGESAARRLRMLAALEIDVWTLRPARAEVSPVIAVSAQEALPARTGAGPAAARALLEASTAPSIAPASSPSIAPSGARTSAAVVAQEPAANSGAETPAESIQPLDLWCLSSPHGVLLAHHEGLSPLAQRLLKDILHSATRVIGDRLRAATATDAPKKISRTKLQALRFSWPPTTNQGGDLLAGQDTARALRGFLSRQLKSATEPVLLYVADDIGDLLAGIDLPVKASRCVGLESTDLLMSDSTTKRALWRTLSAL